MDKKKALKLKRKYKNTYVYSKYLSAVTAIAVYYYAYYASANEVQCSSFSRVIGILFYSVCTIFGSEGVVILSILFGLLLTACTWILFKW